VTSKKILPGTIIGCLLALWFNASAFGQGQILGGAKERQPGYGMVFTKRTQTVLHHKGEISFPGGMRDPGDDDLRATEVVLRVPLTEQGALVIRIELLQSVVTDRLEHAEPDCRAGVLYIDDGLIDQGAEQVQDRCGIVVAAHAFDRGETVRQFRGVQRDPAAPRMGRTNQRDTHRPPPHLPRRGGSVGRHCFRQMTLR